MSLTKNSGSAKEPRRQTLSARTSPAPAKAAALYVEQLGFTITDPNPGMIGLHGKNINLFIEPGLALGPVLEVTIDDVAEATRRLVGNGSEVVKDDGTELSYLFHNNCRLVRIGGRPRRCPPYQGNSRQNGTGTGQLGVR